MINFFLGEYEYFLKKIIYTFIMGIYNLYRGNA